MAFWKKVIASIDQLTWFSSNHSLPLMTSGTLYTNFSNLFSSRISLILRRDNEHNLCLAGAQWTLLKRNDRHRALLRFLSQYLLWLRFHMTVDTRQVGIAIQFQQQRLLLSLSEATISSEMWPGVHRDQRYRIRILHTEIIVEHRWLSKNKCSATRVKVGCVYVFVSFFLSWMIREWWMVFVCDPRPRFWQNLIRVLLPRIHVTFAKTHILAHDVNADLKFRMIELESEVSFCSPLL